MIMAWLRIAFTTFALILSTQVANAQLVPGSSSSQTAEVPPPSPNDVKEFLRLLGDPSVQAWISDSANADGTLGQPDSQSLREQIDAQVARISDRARSLVLAWQVLPQMPTVLADVWTNELSHAQKVRSVTYILIFLLIGFGLEWLYRQTVRYPLLRLEQAPKEAPSQKVIGALLRAAIVFTGLGIFAIGSIGAFDSFDWHPLMESLVLDLLVAVLMFRVLVTVSLFFQAPRASELRLVPYGTPAALYLHRIVSIVSLAVVVAFALSFILNRVVEHHGMAAD
ncbi:MAG: hypothetical protein AB3N11_13005, partial [Arenibacterium sp.]